MADGLTAAAHYTNSARQFQALFTAIPFKVTLTDASLADGAVYDGGGTVTVPGANVGDFVLVAPEVDNANCLTFATVTAANTVTVVNLNNTGGAVTAFSGGVVINGLVLSLRGSIWDGAF